MSKELSDMRIKLQKLKTHIEEVQWNLEYRQINKYSTTSQEELLNLLKTQIESTLCFFREAQELCSSIFTFERQIK